MPAKKEAPQSDSYKLVKLRLEIRKLINVYDNNGASLPEDDHDSAIECINNIRLLVNGPFTK